MEEPFDAETAKGYVRQILDGPGMTVFTKRVKEDFMRHGMNSLDAVNVLRGGKVAALAPTPHAWRYQAATRRMTVEFTFRGHGRGGSAAPSELIVESARRNRS